MKIPNLGAAYLRLRHSRGFGVHSPFAFNLITQALWPAKGYGWYGDDIIEREALLPGSRFSRRGIREAQRLLHLLSFLGIKRVFAENPHPLIKVAAQSAAVSIEPFLKASELGPADMIITGPDHKGNPIAMVEKAIDMGANVVAHNPEPHLRQILMATRPTGLRLYGPSAVIAISRPEMIFTTYSVPI